MRKLIWLTLVIATLVTSTFLVANVHAATYVTGPIYSDTTWTKANSPYRLTGSVFVSPGVTLTIEPGVTVDFYAYTLQVGGTLNARGTTDSNIILFSSVSAPTSLYFTYSTSWNESTGTGSIIENAVLSSASISVSSSSPKISNNYFTNNRYTSISIFNGSALILNNAFDTQATGISIASGVPSSPTISRNFIKCSGTSTYGINAGNNNAYISDNNITSCYTGVYATGNLTITRNLIRSSTYGLSTGANATIENNVITNNTYGINGGGTIRNNTIGNNQVGLIVSIGSSTISQNNIFNNTQLSISMAMQSSLDVTYNWWGTTDMSAINQTIFDYKNATGYGKVNFAPILNDLNSAAPSLESIYYVPNPTPTPYPSPIPVPTPTYPPPPPTNITLGPITTPTPTPLPTATPTPTSTPIPTPSPTPKIMPGSPLSLGGQTFAETLSQFDLVGLAKLVLIALGIMWVIVILVSVDRKFGKREPEKQ
ncbi:MAG: right-handed parallel beta-helix repeat-containing protein [Candidatus Bathyarchaeota archaeon]|nr:right-handed parallel beta-helix repeat-containing protein [Candidatus Bathyarchaeota archaeon]